MKTILVIDDFASVRYYHTTLLKGAGYQAHAAANGADALAQLEKSPVDLVMLDLVMPSMHGTEVIRRLRALPRHAQTPVLIITSETQQAEIDAIQNDPACHVLTKPILPNILLSEIQQRLR